MRALTIRQPWASLVALGVKTIETRSWSTRYRGPLAIHAGAAQPQRGEAPGLGVPVGDWLPVRGGFIRMNDGWWLEHYASGHSGAPEDAPLHLGAVVATCTLVDVVPMVNNDDPRPHRSCLVLDCPHDGDLPHHRGGLWLIGTNALTMGRPTHVEDQRPYGDFAPGRYAWLLADITPCDPIPAKGKQGLWEWILNGRSE